MLIVILLVLILAFLKIEALRIILLFVLLRAQRWIHQSSQQLEVSRNPGSLCCKVYTKLSRNENLKTQRKYIAENWIREQHHARNLEIITETCFSTVCFKLS